MDVFDAFYDLGDCGGFEEVACCAGFYGLEYVGFFVGLGEYDNFCCGCGCFDAADGF